MSSQWLRCGALVTGYGDSPEADMAVRVDQGTIAELRPWADGRGVDGEVVNLENKTLAPGFVDAHVHLAFNGNADHAATRQMVESADASALIDRAADHALACLLGGVTTVRDCGDKDFATLAIRDEVMSGRRPRPRILAAGPPMTTAGGHLHWCGGVVTDVPTAVGRLFDRGVDLIKVVVSGGSMTAESDLYRPQFTSDELRTIVALAHGHGVRVAAHAHGTQAIRQAAQAGVDTIEHCTWRSRTGEPDVADEVVADIVRYGIFVVLTMAGIQRGLLPEEADRQTAMRTEALAASATGDLHKDFSWARGMRAVGAQLVLASDAGVRLTPFRRFHQTIACGVVALDLTASQAIGLATLQAARALGVDDTVGSIEVGKVADLVVLEGTLDDRTARPGQLRQVWQAGRLVAEYGAAVRP